jgi:radical SAM protein with 4Fe4S-binding SPASM domain
MFELTHRCNLDCAHCCVDIHHPPPEMTTAEACAVIDQLAGAGTLFLVLTGGEVLLRKDALEVAAHARRRGLAIRLFTNATRIDRKMAQAIAGVRPLTVEVSVYGVHAAAHDGVTRRRRALRRTLRGVVHLRRAGVPVRLKAPLLGPTTAELDGLSRIAARLGAGLAFDPLVRPRNDGERGPLALRAPTAALAAALDHPAVRLLPAELPPPPSEDEAPCAIGRRAVRIAPNGDVYPCASYPLPVGNVLQTPFSAIWAGGPLLDRLRAVRRRDLVGACAGCGQAGYCHRCMATALLEGGDELGPSPESCRLADASELARGRTPAPRPPARRRLHVVS